MGLGGKGGGSGGGAFERNVSDRQIAASLAAAIVFTCATGQLRASVLATLPRAFDAA